MGLPPDDDLAEWVRRPMDLDGNDLAEVRRRAVDPVLAALLREDELDSVALGVGGPPGSPWRGHEEEVWLAVVARGETFHCFVCKAYAWSVSAEEAAAQVHEELQEFIAESAFGWGELRTSDYVVPPPPA